MRWIHGVVARQRQRAALGVRRAVGLTQTPPARCDDPALAYGDVHGVTRLVQGDLPSMLIGGIGSLFFQMLHPYAMAGVAEHSRYQDDPLGRLLQTANFLGATTFGSSEDARRAIDRVLAVHQSGPRRRRRRRPLRRERPRTCCSGCTAPRSRCSSPAYQRFGAWPLSDEEADRYVKETARARARPRGARTARERRRARDRAATNFDRSFD